MSNRQSAPGITLKAAVCPLAACLAAVLLLGCARGRVGERALAAGAALSSWQTDSALVRMILDTNGLSSVPVDMVARRIHDRVVSLEFSRRTALIRRLPGYVGGLSHLSELIVTDCDLRSLPGEIDCLEELALLRLDRNRLMNLPEEIGELPRLRELSLSRNQLVELPESLLRLRALRLLNVAHNRLTNLPDSLGQLHMLKGIDVSYNRLEALPASLRHCDSLLTLKSSHNALREIPDGIALLPSLRILDVSNNQLQALPGRPGGFSVLNVLQCAYNELQRLPASLANASGMILADVTHNRLSAIPAAMAGEGRLARLVSLRVDHNRLCAVGPVVAAFLDTRAPRWRLTQECGRAPVKNLRYVSVQLGDTVDVDGHCVAFLGVEKTKHSYRLLLQLGGKCIVASPGQSIGHPDLGSKLVRFIDEAGRRRIEIAIEESLVLPPPASDEYEIVGIGSMVQTSQAGFLGLLFVGGDTAGLVTGSKQHLTLRSASAATFTASGGRVTLTLRWVFSGTGAAPEFYPDSAVAVYAAGVSIDGSNLGYRPMASMRQSLIAADPDARVTIYDLGGRLLASSSYERLEELSASMPNGSYIRKAEGGSEVLWDRFVVKR